MSKRKKQPITHHIEVRSSPQRIKPIEVRSSPQRIKPIEVHNRTTPLYIYKRAIRNINGDIRAMKHDIWQARLLKVQAYIAYRLTK
jgi:hypothetical protein